MKIALVLLFTVVTSWAAKLDAEYDWEAWKRKHSKLYYDDREEALRRKIWENNRQFVYQHNLEAMKKMHTFTVEMNKFADLEGEEFAKYFLGARMNRSNSYSLTISSIMVLDKTYGNLPAEVDWRTEGIVTPVKNQGLCGSCWAFSTTGSLEGQHARANGYLVSLSEQNLMDCSRHYRTMGCHGGSVDNAFQYIIANGGIDTEESYPYIAQDSDICLFSKLNIGATMSSCVDVMPRQDEDALQQAVACVGPISIAIDSSQRSFQLYSGGVYSDSNCSSDIRKLNHDVLVVGYGTEANGGDYWIVKNSWGEGWGMKGYIHMSRNNNNNCGVATQASYPKV